VSDARLHQLIRDLREHDVDVGGLEALEDELQALEDPGFWQRLRGFFDRQVGNVLGELRESGQLVGLIRRAVQGEELDAEESSRVREQLGDLARLVPASALALAIEAIPIPGTSVATPWLLSRLGLMPSHWREAHVLARLRDEAQGLRRRGLAQAADQVDLLVASITAEADRREVASSNADLLLHWDLDRDGQWDPHEVQAYESWLSELRGQLPERGWDRRWFLWHRGQVFGPVRVEELRQVEVKLPLLVCLEGEQGWVALRDLLEG
jgi:hypothetical protein